MRRLLQRRHWAVAAFLVPFLASADPQDFQLYTLGNPSVGQFRYDPGANANFHAFAKELGAAITSVDLTPPRTLGHAGFFIGGEVSVLYLNGRTPDGTPLGQNEFFIPTQNPIERPLLLPSIHVRKGLPFSLELGARLGWIDKSRMGVATGELRWAVTEGFALLPDIAIRAFATRLVNTRDFDLTAGGLDFGIGKQLSVGGMVTFTPYVGWALGWINATSGMVDFRPERTAAESVSSPNAQLQQDTSAYRSIPFWGSPHNRLYGGIRFIGGVVQLGAEVSYAVLGQVVDDGVTRALPPVFAFNSTFGLDF